MSADPTTIEEGERMFAHGGRLFKGLATALCALALVAAGCGGDSSEEAPTTADTAEADQEDVEVIEAWAGALADGDVEGAADYFATPSSAQNGPLLVEIESTEDAIAFNESLPCGAEVVSARSEGEFTTATFRLSERPGPGECGSGTGQTASTSFVIEDGEIVEWRRVGESPPPGGGDGGSAPV